MATPCRDSASALASLRVSFRANLRASFGIRREAFFLSWFTNGNGKMRIINYVKRALVPLGNHRCCGAILRVLLIIRGGFYREWLTFKTYCKNWLAPFFCRFFFLLIVGAILLRCLAFAICKLDSLDVVQRATAYLAPYHASVPFMLILLALALVCCIPGGPTSLLDLSKRLKKAGPFEFFASDDPDVSTALFDINPESKEENKLSKLKRTMLRMKYKNELKGIPQKGLDSALMILDDLIARKRNLIDFHTGQIGAVLARRDVKLGNSDLFFDAYLERDADRIAVRVLPAYSKCVSDVAKSVKELLERTSTTKANAFFVHLVFFKTSDGNDKCNELEHVRRILFNFTNARLFFYDIGDNNAVAPSENIP